MDQNATLGKNRTGIAAAPQRAEEMRTGMDEFPPTSQGSAQDIANVRIAYAKEAEPMGSVPLPATWTATAHTAVKALKGEQPILFLDKLGERLAFERTGTRLYEALVSKYDAFGSFSGGPSRDDLEQIRQEEYGHFVLLQSAIEQLGGDPTTVTPSANLQATVAHGHHHGARGPTDDPAAVAGGDPRRRAGGQCLLGSLIELAQEAGEEPLVPAVRGGAAHRAGAPHEGAHLAGRWPGTPAESAERRGR